MASWVSKCQMFLICWMLSIVIWHSDVIWCLKVSSLSSRTPRYLIISATLISMLLTLSDVVMHLSRWGIWTKKNELSFITVHLESVFIHPYTFRSIAHFSNSCTHLTSSSQRPALNLSSKVWSSMKPLLIERWIYYFLYCAAVQIEEFVLQHKTLEVCWREDFTLMSNLFQC